MAVEWYYQSDSGRVGPYSSPQIRDLLKAGTITPATPLQREGETDWVPIGQIPEISEPHPSGSNTPPQEESTAASPTMIEQAQAAAKATALAAEKKRIELINLPAAYRELGRQCFQERRWAADFPEAYRELDSLHEQSAQSQKRSGEIPPGTTMSEKAKALASKGVEYTTSQRISAQIQTALANLGKEAYAKHRLKAGTDSVTSTVASLTTRLDQIGKEQGSSLRSGLHPLVVGSAIAAFFPIGMILLWFHPTLGRNRTWWAAACCWAAFILYTTESSPPSPPSESSEPVTSQKEAANPPPPTEGDGKPKRLTRGWLESLPTYARRVVNTTLTSQYGPIRLDLKEYNSDGRTTNRLIGEARFEVDGNPRLLHINVMIKGRDFGWSSSTYDEWFVQPDAARFWDYYGQPISETDFVTRFYDGITSETMRMNSFERRQREGKRNLESFRKALQSPK